MTNHFSVLGLPESLSTEPETIENAWRELTRALSLPDTPAENRDSSELNEARALLLDPTLRLEHWLKVKGASGGRASILAPSLMDLFGAIEPALSRCDELVSRHRAASTALAKALLAKETVALQLEIQGLMQKIQVEKQSIMAAFPAFEIEASQGEFVEAQAALGHLKFLRKWEQQCQERVLALISCD